MHQPGERWMYHISFDVLGVLLARASGKPLEDLLRERLFEPLGMKDTAFNLSAAQLERLATSYQYRPQAGTLTLDDGVEDSLWSRSPAFTSASGGLVSTVDDYAAFGRMMLNQGRHNGEQILSKRSVEAMTSDHIPPEQKAISDFFPGFWDTRGWGFGLAVVTEPDELSATPGRYGWDGGYGTSWACDPHEDLFAVFMIQCMNFDGAPWIGEEFWRSLSDAMNLALLCDLELRPRLDQFTLRLHPTGPKAMSYRSGPHFYVEKRDERSIGRAVYCVV